MKRIELEDLITALCEYFCENIQEIQNHHKSTTRQAMLGDSIEWYNKRSQKEKRKISEKLLDIIEGDYKKHGHSSDSKRASNKKM